MTDQYNAARMAAVQEMAHLARMIETSEDGAIIGQAARVFNAIRAMPDADFAAQSHLATVKCQAQIIATMRGELAAKEAECAELASRINAPSGDYWPLLKAEYERHNETADLLAKAVKKIYELEYAAPVAQPLAASAPSVDRNAVQAVILNARAVIKRWDSPLWRQEVHTADFINQLRKSVELAESHAAAPRQEAQPERSDKPAVQAVTGREWALDAALRKVMSWISNWNPDFTDDAEWPADRAAALDALAARSQQPAASPTEAK